MTTLDWNRWQGGMTRELWVVFRTGFARGRIEFRHTLTTGSDLWSYLFPAVIFLVVMALQRNSTVPGTDFSLGANTLPSLLGAGIAMGGLMTVTQLLVTEREDGTLLRAKATPHGMGGYVVGKIVTASGMTLVSMVVQTVGGLLLLDGFDLGPAAWLTFLWVLVLGLTATIPIGIVLGSLLPSSRSMGLVMLPLLGLMGISGTFYPIVNFPAWLQGIAQVFPVYWLGLGMRSALLPDQLAAVEIAGSWRHLATVGVLLAWAVAGLVLAPVVLRRMARKESGASMASRREKAMRGWT